MIAPKPAHHVRQNRAALLLPMQADAPGVIEVVSLLRQCIGEANVLIKPVARLVVFSILSHAAMVVAAILHEDANRLFLSCQYFFRIDMSSSEICEAADDGEDLSKLIRPLPRHRERGYSTRACAADAMPLRVGRDVVLLL